VAASALVSPPRALEEEAEEEEEGSGMVDEGGVATRRSLREAMPVRQYSSDTVASRLPRTSSTLSLHCGVASVESPASEWMKLYDRFSRCSFVQCSSPACVGDGGQRVSCVKRDRVREREKDVRSGGAVWLGVKVCV